MSIDRECIEWPFRKNKKGYGVIGAKNIKAHRWEYERYHGPIPDGMIVMHTCDNPSCVNPDHLQVGTHLDNVRDCINKGRRHYATRDTLKNAKLTSAHKKEIIQLRDDGWSIGRLAAHYSVSKSTMHAFICSCRSGTVAAPQGRKVVGVLGFEPRTSSSRTRLPDCNY